MEKNSREKDKSLFELLQKQFQSDLDRSTELAERNLLEQFKVLDRLSTDTGVNP